MLKYSALVRWSDEDEGFIATVPELRGLSAFGENREEALLELEVAQALFVEDVEAAKEALPQPIHVQTHSGQFRLRLPKSLHSRCAFLAESEGVSLNTYIVTKLSGLSNQSEQIRRVVREEFVDLLESSGLLESGNPSEPNQGWVGSNPAGLRVLPGGRRDVCEVQNYESIAV